MSDTDVSSISELHPVYLYSELTNQSVLPHMKEEIGRRLKEHGWLYIADDNFPQLFSTLEHENWQKLFGAMFSLDTSEKIASAGMFRGEQGVTVGYREDDNREFVETRVFRNGDVCPSFEASIRGYDECVRKTYQGYYFTARSILSCISETLGIDDSYLLDLTDIPRGHQRSNIAAWDEPSIDEGELSSSLLRICNYPGCPSVLTPTDRSDPTISFGSHTDTSFITIGLIGETSGMEIYDLKHESWVAVESTDALARLEVITFGNGMRASGSVETTGRLQLMNRMVVFTGEFLQLLTGHSYIATVHRVRTPDQLNARRVSCPFLIRGRDKAVVHTITRTRPGDVIFSNLPDLTGSSMRLLHKLLDYKRSKCMKANKDNHDDWILKAY